MVQQGDSVNRTSEQAQGLTSHELSTGHRFLTGRLPDGLIPSGAAFEAVWGLHPEERPEVMMVGRRVQTPCWQKAYGREYRFAGGRAVADEVPALLVPFLDSSRSNVSPLL